MKELSCNNLHAVYGGVKCKCYYKPAWVTDPWKLSKTLDKATDSACNSACCQSALSQVLA